jgi:hypothetical protein
MTGTDNQKSGSVWFINSGVRGFNLNSLPRCQAVAKTTGNRCKNPAMKGRDTCCVHAGLYKPGPPMGNKNSLKNGRYTAKAIGERKAAAAFIKESNDLVDSIMRGVSTF